jgi:prepilin-type N-terminal cleavage/methylation domain-containing protein
MKRFLNIYPPAGEAGHLTPNRHRHGYTLIELLISMAVVAILTAGIVVVYQYFKRDTETESAAQKTIASLRETQGRALSSQDNSNWGVHFGTNSDRKSTRLNSSH